MSEFCMKDPVRDSLIGGVDARKTEMYTNTTAQESPGMNATNPNAEYVIKGGVPSHKPGMGLGK